MKRDPMKTLWQQVKQMSRKISRVLADYRDALSAWLHEAASKLFPTPAPVRIANRPQKQSPLRRLHR
jgi:hypothetical protein